jgi:hypothetical protein
MDEITIAAELKEQFSRAWKMIEETITGFSETDWISCGTDYLVPARIAYHLIETVEFYIGNKPRDFGWGQRFGGGWQRIEKEHLPKQEDMLSYMEETASALSEWLSHCDFGEANRLFKHTGSTLLGHALYVLRHTLDHHGQMNCILYQSGNKTVNWH